MRKDKRSLSCRMIIPMIAKEMEYWKDGIIPTLFLLPSFAAPESLPSGSYP